MEKNTLLFIFVAVLIGLFLIIKALSVGNWTLMVCKTSSDNFTCDKNKYISKGFVSLEMCRKAGQILQDRYGEVYECGSDCSFIDDNSGDMSCKQMCDRKGCTDKPFSILDLIPLVGSE